MWLTLILAAATSPSAGNPIGQEGVEYRTCIEREAKRMSKSKETAPTVATAAIEGCKERRETLEIAMMANLYVDHPDWAIARREQTIASALEIFDRRVRNRAIFIVTNARAK